MRPNLQIRDTRRNRGLLAAFLLAAIWGFVDAGRRSADLAQRLWQRYEIRLDAQGPPIRPRRQASSSVLPGPPRTDDSDFQLNAENALRLSGMDDPAHERWADIAGNYYTREFTQSYTYADYGAETPAVYIRYDERATTFRGRLEARGLKPNFAYQIKLLGDPAHRESFEKLGYTGRWRLPDGGTNYTDDDYRQYPDKERVEAYIFFDFFVTDAEGNAVREFALDHSLHVLWSASRQRTEPAQESDAVVYTVDATSPSVYVQPRRNPTREGIFAEREHARYQGDHTINLPNGDYRCFLILTEESFHSTDNNGGYWATVYKSPIQFTIAPPPAAVP